LFGGKLQKMSKMFPFITKNKVVDDRGYVLVLCPNHPRKKHGNYVYEHRLVMENHLGRPLTEDEVVHHINGDKSDNRIENLQLFSNDSEHHIHEWKQGTYNPQPIVDEKIRQQVIDYVKQGHTYSDAVKKFGYALNTVKKWCTENSVKSKRSWHSRKERETVRSLYQQGFSYREIRAKTGIAICLISKWFKKLGKKKYSRSLN